jgi:hypothetical protein
MISFLHVWPVFCRESLPHIPRNAMRFSAWRPFRERVDPDMAEEGIECLSHSAVDR